MTIGQTQDAISAWNVTLATDHDGPRTFHVYALERADAVTLARQAWGAGSAWTFVKDAARVGE